MLPKPHYLYSLPLESSTRFLVTCTIPFDLRFPKRAVCSRQMTTPWASMPEATIHKDRKFLGRKEKIRVSSKPFRPYLPPAYASPNQAEPQSPLCRSIVASTDRLHYPRPQRARPLEFSVGQVDSQRSFHRSNALVVKSGHCGRKPE